MVKPTRILLSDDLYALEEEGGVSRSIYSLRPSARPETIRERRKARGYPVAPGTEPPREARPSPLIPMLAAGISGAVVGAVLVLVLT